LSPGLVGFCVKKIKLCGIRDDFASRAALKIISPQARRFLAKDYEALIFCFFCIKAKEGANNSKH
jgi:hypothetical protein